MPQLYKPTLLLKQVPLLACATAVCQQSASWCLYAGSVTMARQLVRFKWLCAAQHL